MAINIQGGGSSAGKANVTATYELNVVTPQVEENAGFVQVSSEIDSGVVLGTRTVLPMEISDDYRVRVGVDQSIFNLSFEGGNTQAHMFNIPTSTMGTAQSNNHLILNQGLTTTAGTYVYVFSRRTFTLFGTYPVYFDTWLKEANHTAENAISEWGIGSSPATNSVPTDGVFFRRNDAGVLRAVINYNGTETEVTINTTNIPSKDGVGLYDPAEENHFLVVIHNDVCRFWINDTLVASIDCPGNQPTPTSATSQTLMYRVRNSGIASAGRQIHIGFINVSLGDQNSTKTWPHVLCGAGGGSYQNQPGTAPGQTANWVNSTAPVLATLSNTAAGYTTLGGQYRFAATATNETDWALFAYLNPAGSTTIPAKTLYITGIRVSKMLVTGAATANTTMFFWACGVGSSAVSLATTDSTTTVSPKRIPLGISNFLAAAPIGTSSEGFDIDFDNGPLVVFPGTYFHIILKQLNGAATASLEFRGQITIIGYFE